MESAIEKYLQERINFAEDRIKFWEGRKDIQQVWIGIKFELTLLRKRLK